MHMDRTRPELPLQRQDCGNVKYHGETNKSKLKVASARPWQKSPDTGKCHQPDHLATIRIVIAVKSCGLQVGSQPTFRDQIIPAETLSFFNLHVSSGTGLRDEDFQRLPPSYLNFAHLRLRNRQLTNAFHTSIDHSSMSSPSPAPQYLHCCAIVPSL